MDACTSALIRPLFLPKTQTQATSTWHDARRHRVARTSILGSHPFSKAALRRLCVPAAGGPGELEDIPFESKMDSAGGLSEVLLSDDVLHMLGGQYDFGS